MVFPECPFETVRQLGSLQFCRVIYVFVKHFIWTRHVKLSKPGMTSQSVQTRHVQSLYPDQARSTTLSRPGIMNHFI